MKKIILLALTLVLFAGCGVGTHSVQSGKEDGAAISFTSTKASSIDVSIDGKNYSVKSVSVSAFKKKVNFKQTTSNTIQLTPGTHEVKVVDRKGNEIYSKKLFISNQEHRIINL